MAHPAETYVSDAIRTESKVGNLFLSIQEARLLHSILGKMDEIGELAKELKAYLWYGKTLDHTNCKEELGDDLWYTALAMSALETDFDEVMQKNIQKLKTRYPDKFDTERAINRDIGKERDVLES